MKGLSLGVGGFGGWSHTVHSSVRFQCLEAGEPPPNCVRSGLDSSEPTHHGHVPALEELWLFVHRQSSYKLLLIMAMYLGPAHISICSPVPPDFWAPSILRTAVPTAGACRPGAGFSLIPTAVPARACVWLPTWYSIPVGVGPSVSSIRLRPRVGRNRVDHVAVISTLTFSARPDPAHRVATWATWVEGMRARHGCHWTLRRQSSIPASASEVLCPVLVFCHRAVMAPCPPLP